MNKDKWAQEQNIIKKVEDLYNEIIYYVEIKPHGSINGLIGLRGKQLYPVVFYGFRKIHTVPNRLYIRIDAENACKESFLKSRFPINGYNVWWRCWSVKPTNEQMQAVNWE